MNRSVKDLLRPLVLRIRSPLRNALWRIKRVDVENPPIPKRVNSLLFVCLGNICRSPFGAELARRLLAAAGRSEVRCTSAGIRPSQAGRSPDEACTVSARYRVVLDEHVPRPLTRELIQSHDVVFVMELRQWMELRKAYPEFRDRIFLLPLFDADARTPYERFNIADPFGRPLPAYEECYLRIERALTGWLKVSPS